MANVTWNSLNKEDYESLAKNNAYFTSFRNFNKSGIDITVLIQEKSIPNTCITEEKMSFAFCSQKDQFVKKSGQKIAKGRFNKGMTITKYRSADSRRRRSIVEFIENGFNDRIVRKELNGITYYIVYTENDFSLHLPHKLVKSLPMW